MDEIADQAHDRHGRDSVVDPDADGAEDVCRHNQYRCECEQPGCFCSGISGILAHLENGHLEDGAKVERCGLFCRYPCDAAALE